MAQWGNIQIGVPDAVVDLAEIIESFAQALLKILNIALKILQIVKAFLVGFLNPLAAIIEAIIDEIESFLEDIRQLGIYISGDLNPQWPFDELLGGFQAYERRMVGRLTDRSDPTRPAFSSNSSVIAVFLYVSVDPTAIATLIVLIHRIMKFFGQDGDIKQFSVPVGLEVVYGAENDAITKFGGLKPAFNTGGLVQDTALVRWNMAPPAKASPIEWPLPAPYGFLVEVSTIKDGLLLAWEAPTANAENEEGGQTRAFGLTVDNRGRPFRFYGGHDQIDTNGVSLGGDDAIEGNKELKAGAARLVAMRDVNDPAPIPVDKLKSGNRYLLQKTFFVQTGGSAGALMRNVAQGFSIRIPQEEMPYEADFEVQSSGKVTARVGEQATTAFVRVAAVSPNVTDASTYKWTITEQVITSSSQAGKAVPMTVEGNPLNYQDRGPASSPVEISFPSASTSQFLDTVTAALAVVVLSRADLTLGPVGAGEEDGADNEAALAELNEEIESAQRIVTARSQALVGVSGLTPQDLGTTGEDLVIAGRTTQEKLDNLHDAQDDLFALIQKRDRKFPLVVETPTGLEDIARFVVPMVVGRNPAKFYRRDRLAPAKFRRAVLRRCRSVANQLYRRSGNMGPTIEELVVTNGAVLTGESAFKWSDYDIRLPDLTILESLDTTTFLGASPKQGVALNPFALAVDPTNLMERFSEPGGVTLSRPPGFRTRPGANTSVFIEGDGSADRSPVVYHRSGENVEPIYFTRNVFHEYNSGEVLSAAQVVLGIAAAPLTLNRPPGGEGGWIAIRLLPQGLPPIEAFLDTIVDWLNSIKAGIDSIVDVILRYIEFIEARILEVQAIINRIVNLLGQLTALQVPAASGVVTVANGTDGILSELITAENKPSDAPSAYGGGVVILSGGLNSSLTALLQAFFAAG